MYVYGARLSCSPDDVHWLLFTRCRGERGKPHHFSWIPQRLLQVASLYVSLKVGQPQHTQVQRVCGNAGQA